MQLKDVTPIIKAILEERDKIPIIHNMERYIPNWTPWHAGNFMRGGIRKALRIIEQAPVVDAVEVVHARWSTHQECSACGDFARYSAYGEPYYSRYCPNCGAKMDGGANDE